MNTSSVKKQIKYTPQKRQQARVYVADNLFIKKNKKKQKKNSAKKTMAAMLWLTLTSSALYVNTNNFLEPVYINRIKNRNLHYEVKTLQGHTLNYLNNANFNNINLLLKRTVARKKEIIPVISTGENIILKSKIENILKDYQKLEAGVFVFDYLTGKAVNINADETFSSASIIKIPVLLNLFYESKLLEKEGFDPIDLSEKMTFEEQHRTEGSGHLQYESADQELTLDYLSKIMIRNSDNSATNMLIEKTGGLSKLNSSLAKWGFEKTRVADWLPDLKGKNVTTPSEIGTMLYNIDNIKFLPEKSSARIKDIMSGVLNQTLIKSQLPEDATIFHKTGDIGKMLGDAGIIISPTGKKFILVIMVKRPYNDYGARELIQKVSKTVYETLK